MLLILLFVVLKKQILWAVNFSKSQLIGILRYNGIICWLRYIVHKNRIISPSMYWKTLCHAVWINNWLQLIEIPSIHLEWQSSWFIGSISFSRFGEFACVNIASSKNQIHLFIIFLIFQLDINYRILSRIFQDETETYIFNLL